MNDTKILFVCMGNICRSPSAHAIMQHKVNELGCSDGVLIDSAGTHAYHVGERADSRARAVARSKGVDAEYIRARKISIMDYDRFDYILAMDAENLSLIEYYAPDNPHAQMCLFLSFAYQAGLTDQLSVPDPYYGSESGFQDVFQLIDIGCTALIDFLNGE